MMIPAAKKTEAKEEIMLVAWIFLTNIRTIVTGGFQAETITNILQVSSLCWLVMRRRQNLVVIAEALAMDELE